MRLLFAATLLLSAPAAAAPDFDVIRAGDAALSCKALAGEINALTRTTTKQRERAAARANGGGGLGKLFGTLRPAALPMLDRVVARSGGTAGTAALIARDTLERGDTGSSASTAQPAPQAAPPSLEAQRLERLNGLHTSKRC